MTEDILLTLQLDVREIKTLIVERKSDIEKIEKDTDLNFSRIRHVETEVTNINKDIEHIKSELTSVLEGQQGITERLTSIEKANHKMLWVFNAAMGGFGTVLVAIAIKYFAGG
jgi:chromosome segregation ATPase